MVCCLFGFGLLLWFVSVRIGCLLLCEVWFVDCCCWWLIALSDVLLLVCFGLLVWVCLRCFGLCFGCTGGLLGLAGVFVLLFGFTLVAAVVIVCFGLF